MRTAASLAAVGWAMTGSARGEGVGEAVVAVDAGDFFDEVDLALEVEAPGGEFGEVDVESVEDELAAERGEVAGDDLAGDAFGVDGRAEVALDLFYGELDGGTVGGRAATSGSMTSMSSPSIFPPACEDELGDEGVGDGGGVEVGAALEAVGGVGVEEVAAGAATDGGGVEPGGLDEDVFGFGGDHGVPAAHDSGEGEGLLFVGYDEVVGFEGALGSVEEFELFAFVGEADDDASFDLVEVEGVGGVAHAEEDEVAGVDGVRDLFLAEEGEVFGDVAGAGRDGDVAEDLGGEAAAEAFGVGGDADGEGAVDEGADGELGVEGLEREVVDGGGFAGDAVVVHGVDAVGGDVHLEEVAVALRPR